MLAMFAWAEGRLFQRAFEHAKASHQVDVLTALRKVQRWSDHGLIAPTTPSSTTTGNHCYVLWMLKNGNFKRRDDPAIKSKNPGGYRCDGQFRKD
jgi:hypothetical protein